MRIETRRRSNPMAEKTVAPATSGDAPRRAMRHVEPLGVARAADKTLLLRIPSHLLAVIIGEGDQRADEDGGAPTPHAANRPIPAAQTPSSSAIWSTSPII